MSLSKVSAGNNFPAEFNVIVEIPMNSDPVKFEIDKESSAMRSEARAAAGEALPVEMTDQTPDATVREGEMEGVLRAVGEAYLATR